MSVKLGLMALLAEGERYGAQLRGEFEERTGGTWPLNVGQVYTTLDRLVRDGLVEQTGAPDPEGRIGYRLTTDGHSEVAKWWLTPVDRDRTPRDELAIKLALAVTVPGVDVARVAQTQRTATLRHLHDLTRLKRQAVARHQAPPASDHADADRNGQPASPTQPADPNQPDSHDESHDLAWLLVLESLIFAAEAEVRWLDHVETMLAREAIRHRPTRATRPSDTRPDTKSTTNPSMTSTEAAHAAAGHGIPGSPATTSSTEREGAPA